MRGARPDYALELAFAGSQALVPGKSAVLAVSGGSDSVALAGLAAAAAARNGAKLCIVHVNHGIRPSAAQDEAVTTALGAHLHLPVHVVSIMPDGNDEAGLRKLRYGALTAAARAVGAQTVLTGHTAQDQTETVLLALFRGTGRAGLCGMPVRRKLADELALIRPLLRADRASLQRYCERHHLPYAVDPTNADEDYTRNAIRRHLTELRALFPGLDRAIARCATILREEAEQRPSALLRQAVRASLHEAGLANDLTYERIDAAARILQLSGDRLVRIEREDES